MTKLVPFKVNNIEKVDSKENFTEESPIDSLEAPQWEVVGDRVDKPKPTISSHFFPNTGAAGGEPALNMSIQFEGAIQPHAEMKSHKRSGMKVDQFMPHALTNTGFGFT